MLSQRAKVEIRKQLSLGSMVVNKLNPSERMVEEKYTEDHATKFDHAEDDADGKHDEHAAIKSCVGARQRR
ncbi:hypothetical protein CDL15_Pgr009086 [Punica granatum]|nr:hypothetical protein CDL15_Pgr009086 [Punica granatum]